MKRRMAGPSLYYATDKNVYEALNQHKVDAATVWALFIERNILMAPRTKREALARYFSRLTHDYYDHKRIGDRLGITPRRERITSMDVAGLTSPEALKEAIDRLKLDLEATGDVVQVSRSGDNWHINLQYTTVDYARSEFSQVQTRDGYIEFVKTETGYTVRNSQNEYLNDARDSLLGAVDKASDAPMQRTVISLFEIPDAKFRTQFFYDLINDLPEYNRIDVTEIYIYKAKPADVESDASSMSSEASGDSHIERVALRGNGVTRSEILDDLLNKEDFYVFRAGWTIRKTVSTGAIYEIQALFSEPKDCTQFSFILSGVYPFEAGKILSRKRIPLASEIDQISRVIEVHARNIVVKLKEDVLGAVLGEP